MSALTIIFTCFFSFNNNFFVLISTQHKTQFHAAFRLVVCSAIHLAAALSANSYTAKKADQQLQRAKKPLFIIKYMYIYLIIKGITYAKTSMPKLETRKISLFIVLACQFLIYLRSPISY